MRRSAGAGPGRAGWSSARTTPRLGRSPRSSTSSATPGSTTGSTSAAVILEAECGALLSDFFRHGTTASTRTVPSATTTPQPLNRTRSADASPRAAGWAGPSRTPCSMITGVSRAGPRPGPRAGGQWPGGGTGRGVLPEPDRRVEEPGVRHGAGGGILGGPGCRGSNPRRPRLPQHGLKRRGIGPGPVHGGPIGSRHEQVADAGRDDLHRFPRSRSPAARPSARMSSAGVLPPRSPNLGGRLVDCDERSHCPGVRVTSTGEPVTAEFLHEGATRPAARCRLRPATARLRGRSGRRRRPRCPRRQ